MSRGSGRLGPAKSVVLALWVLFTAYSAPKVKLPANRADVARGQKLFEVQCALCHGPKGEGGRGPMLARLKLTHAPDDAALVGVIQDGIPGTEMPGADAMSDHEVLLVAAFVRSLGRTPFKPVPGDPAKGEAIYRGTGNCVGCHSIHGQGGIVGPDLATVGESRNASFLRQTLLEPEKSIPEGYLLVTVVPMAAAEPVTGVQLNEDSFSIQLRDQAGAMHSFSKSEVDRIDRLKGKTLMPSYQGKLSEAEITDLVSFLASLREAK